MPSCLLVWFRPYTTMPVPQITVTPCSSPSVPLARAAAESLKTAGVAPGSSWRHHPTTGKDENNVKSGITMADTDYGKKMLAFFNVAWPVDT